MSEGKKRSLIFTSLSKHNYFFKERICKYVFEKGGIPISAFMCFGYFLWDLVSWEEALEGNNRLLEICDELWVFGAVSPGVAEEIKLAKRLKLPIRYFRLTKWPTKIVETSKDRVEVENYGD